MIGVYAVGAIVPVGVTDAEKIMSGITRVEGILDTKVDKLNPYITETWVSGTSGYRIYSDGFIEQWGKCTSRNITVTFPLAFSNTNYTLVGGLIPGDPTQSYQHLNFKSQTATSFYFQSYDNYTCKWYACGY